MRLTKKELNDAVVVETKYEIVGSFLPVVISQVTLKLPDGRVVYGFEHEFEGMSFFYLSDKEFAEDYKVCYDKVMSMEDWRKEDQLAAFIYGFEPEPDDPCLKLLKFLRFITRASTKRADHYIAKWKGMRFGSIRIPELTEEEE